MADGERTARTARLLAKKLDPRGIDVLFDHGKKGVDPPEKLGQIVSWFGPEYKAPARLAFLDMAIVSRASGKALALLEIEESAATPKVLLGDVLATLLGSAVTFQGQHDLRVGEWTTLIVLAQSKTHRAQVDFLRDKLDQIRSSLTTPNASIGRLIVDLFQDEGALQAKVAQLVDEAIARAEESQG